MLPSASPSRHLRRRVNRGRLFLEALEDRSLLNCGPNGTLIEGFDDTSMSAYSTVVRHNASAVVAPELDCDGSPGLFDYDGDDWIIRQDAGSVVRQGDVLSAWVYLGGEATGRAYLGFGSIRPGLNQRLTTGGTLSVVLAPNTNEFAIQAHAGYKFINNASGCGSLCYAQLGSTPYNFAMNQWYRVEVYWLQGGLIFAVLYDVEYNLLTAAVGQQNSVHTATSGGIAFRGFGEDAFYIWNSVLKPDYGFGGGGFGDGGFRAPPRPGKLPDIQGRDLSNLGNNRGPTTQGIPFPFEYVSTPGSVRDIRLENITGYSQLSCSAQQCPDGTYQGMIGMQFGNTSRNMGPVTVAWGPSLVGHFSNDTPQNSPHFQMYIYALDPGGEAFRIGESGIKAFWSSTWGYDYQFIAPAGQSGDQDTYSPGHNSDRRSFSSMAAMNPVTGERYDYGEMGDRNVHGNYVLRSRSFSDPFENLLKVNAAELNPATHPGRRYFAAANIYVVADNNTANNSRWQELRVTPQAQPNRYSFGTIGGLNFDICTIPNLPALGRCAGDSPYQGPGDRMGTPLDEGTAVVRALLAGPAELAPFAVLPPTITPAERAPSPAPLDQLFAGQPQEVATVTPVLPMAPDLEEGDLDLVLGGL